MSDACTSPLAGYGVLAERLRAKAARARIPLEGSIELTARCNLACGHCYINQPGVVPAGAPAELDTAALRGVLDQLAASGCLWLGITGGEPLLHPGFAAIYRHARERGFLVTLLTNGTLIDDAVADLLAALPPLVVEVTLYGHTAATAAAVTGVAGAHAACREGIARLAARGVRYRLKTTLTAANRHELDAMRAFAAEQGVAFRSDGLLNARLDGSPLPPGVALAPADLVDLELGDGPTREAWRARIAQQGAPGRSPHPCAAGVSAFHVDFAGRLTPCLMARRPAVSVVEGSFAAAWDGPIREAVAAWTRGAGPCGGCALAGCCDACPGWGLITHGDADRPVEPLCRVAEERARILGVAGCAGRSVA